MVIRKIDYKKEQKENKNIFGLPFLSLALFLILLIVLLVLPPVSFMGNVSVSPINPITGHVISGIALSQEEYGPREQIKGDMYIELRWGDHIPATTNVEITIPGENINEPKKIIMQLPQAIVLSETPWSGNYTYGEFRNMNGPSPSGEGYGFDACKAIPIVPPQSPIISGRAAQSPGQPPIQLPDLTVNDIYTSSIGVQPMGIAPPPQQPLERLYTKIANIGTRSTLDPNAPAIMPFIVKGCWYEPSGIAPNCFFEQAIDELAAGGEITLDMGTQNVEGKTVQVIVDSTNIIVESNENNNQMIKSFGVAQPMCSDSDNGDPYIQGLCTDGSMLPMLKQDTCINESYLLEWSCPPEAPTLACFATEIFCQKGCVNGACVPLGPSPTCNDTDGGNRPYIKGTCTDKYDSYDDFCPPTIPEQEEKNIAEFFCTGNSWINYDSECSDCSAPTCNYIGTRSEGWYAKCPKGEKLIKYELCEGREKFAPVCLYPDTKSEGWYTSDVCDAEYSNCNYGCKDGACKISNYSCDDWNNIYVINLSKLALRTPQERGNYNITVELTYESALPEPIILYSSTVPFAVASHRACQGVNNCRWFGGMGPDQCDINSDCKGGNGGGGGGGGGCIELWTYGTWSECIAGQRTRDCYDSRGCGTTYAKPTYCLPSGTKFIQTESCVPGCQEQWNCSEWSYCNQETQEQSSVCEELNKCNPINYTYIQLRDCCVEEWDCKWSSCIKGTQEKVCTDSNNCGSEFTKPQAESKACKGMAWFVYVIIAVAAVVIILAILYATKVIKFSKQPVKETAEEEPHFTEVKV